MADAAIYLIEIIRRHGWSLHNEGYTAQTAAMNSLIQELQKEPALGYIQTINAEVWLEKLIDAQSSFEAANQESEEIDAQEKPLITSGKKALLKDLIATLSHIESQAEFNTSDDLTTLVNNINQVIVNITASAKARNTRKQS